jgi:hypothetical protein
MNQNSNQSVPSFGIGGSILRICGVGLCCDGGRISILAVDICGFVKSTGSVDKSGVVLSDFFRSAVIKSSSVIESLDELLIDGEASLCSALLI